MLQMRTVIQVRDGSPHIVNFPSTQGETAAASTQPPTIVEKNIKPSFRKKARVRNHRRGAGFETGYKDHGRSRRRGTNQPARDPHAICGPKTYPLDRQAGGSSRRRPEWIGNDER